MSQLQLKTFRKNEGKFILPEEVSQFLILLVCRSHIEQRKCFLFLSTAPS